MKPLRILISAAAVAATTAVCAGCVETAVGGAAVATTASMEERGFKGAVNDTVIRARINSLWLQHSEAILSKVDMSVSEGRVLLTGVVPTQQMRLEAVRLAWQADGVKEVINEIKVDKKGEGLVAYARDSWITTQLVAKLAIDNKVQSINYSVETVDGVVYLMGIAQDQAELDRVENHARHLSYVRKVVSYVMLKDDPRRRKS